MIDHEPLYTDMDTVYPPMRWVARWSTGSNIPTHIEQCPLIEAAIILAGGTVHSHYEPGLLLFNEEGGMHKVPNGRCEWAGVHVMAYTRRHAVHELICKVSP